MQALTYALADDVEVDILHVGAQIQIHTLKSTSHDCTYPNQPEGVY